MNCGRMNHRIVVGDVMDRLAELPDRSVHCCVTSPPYWGLRDYGAEGQIGLEPTPQEFVARLVAVFREVRRVLRDDGTLWLNMGDSYAGSGKGGDFGNSPKHRSNAGSQAIADSARKNAVTNHAARLRGVVGHKQLLGIPWRLAFALQDDGWVLRQEIIWSKPSPMPESVRDRCTKAHEHIFLLTKKPRYFYDAVAIATPVKESSAARLAQDVDQQAGSDRVPGKTNGTMKACGKMVDICGGYDGHRTRRGASANAEKIAALAESNRRSVWPISPQGFKEAHFATFPPELPRLCILAGTSAHGCCSACGAPWRRVTNERKLRRDRPNDLTKRTGEAGTGNSCGNTVAGVSRVTTGWAASCGCGAAVVPCTVLDPFLGSGTTVMVAKMLGRDGVGVELNPEYAEMARRRIADAPTHYPEPGTPKPRRMPATLPLFE